MTLNGHYKLGLRAIKTAIAVSLCFAISFIFNRDDALFSVIAALICMQQTYDATFRQGMERLLGTIIGGIVGYVALEILNFVPSYNDIFDMFVVPFFMLVVIYICNTIDKKASIVIGCIVVLSIITIPNKDTESALVYVVNRVIDTSIGIVIAMVVNKYFFPNKKQVKPE